MKPTNKKELELLCVELVAIQERLGEIACGIDDVKDQEQERWDKRILKWQMSLDGEIKQGVILATDSAFRHVEEAHAALEKAVEELKELNP